MRFLSRGAFVFGGAALVVIGACGSPSSDGGDGGAGGSEIPGANDGCTSDGISCSCTATCGTNTYGLSCDGSTCSCLENGEAFGSFAQAAACTASGDGPNYAVMAISNGCPVPYPCEPVTSAVSSASSTVASSSTTTAVASSTAVTTSTGSAMTCDDAGSCSACEACAEAGPCVAEFNACGANPDCVAYDTCLAQCGSDLGCRSDCNAMYANVNALYLASYECIICHTCSKDCGSGSDDTCL